MSEETSIFDKIKQYRESGRYNILIPSDQVTELLPGQFPTLECVSLSANPADGDVYEQTKGFGDRPSTYTITAIGLQKLAGCAGVCWSAQHSGITAHERDYVACTAYGGLRKLNGEMIWWKASYDIDIEVERDNIKEAWRGKIKNNWLPGKLKNATKEKKIAYAEDQVTKEVNYIRKHKMSKAETGAQNRVLRRLFGLKKAYTAEELARPFVVLSVSLRPDISDPEINRQLQIALIGQITGVYGPGVPAALPEPDAIDADFRTVPDEPPADAATPELPPQDDTPPAAEPEPALSDAERARQEFVTADKKIKAELITNLAARKGVAGTLEVITPAEKKEGKVGITRPLNTMSDETLEKFYDRLVSMPDDDVPF
jgi:hypothetical protein